MYRAIPWLCAAAAFAQAPASRPQFEVASVKPSPPPEGNEAEMKLRAIDTMQGMVPPGGVPIKGRTVSISGRTLLQLVAMAHKLRPADVVGPGWASELRFDIEAKLPEGAKPADGNEMLLALLEERFGLKTHRETRGQSGYALLVGKDGPRLEPGAPIRTTPLTQQQVKADLDERMSKAKAEMLKPAVGRGQYGAGWTMATMRDVASTVSTWLKAPVVDETGLTGTYSLRLEVARPESPDDSIEYRVSQALAKVGLKLESRKTAPEYLVIDSARKTPAEN